jgi:desulfoferrodoxin (superoxide reductase-like protein)
MGKAKVMVPQPMNDEHFIEYIWAKDQNNVIIGAVKLMHGDLAQLDFIIPIGVTSVTGFEACNK